MLVNRGERREAAAAVSGGGGSRQRYSVQRRDDSSRSTALRFTGFCTTGCRVWQLCGGFPLPFSGSPPSPFSPARTGP